MKERTDHFDFTSMSSMVTFFESFLSREKIDAVIADCKHAFKKRPGSSKSDTQLQLIKKCEWMLSRKCKMSS